MGTSRLKRWHPVPKSTLEPGGTYQCGVRKGCWVRQDRISLKGRYVSSYCYAAEGFQDKCLEGRSCEGKEDDAFSSIPSHLFGKALVEEEGRWAPILPSSTPGVSSVLPNLPTSMLLPSLPCWHSMAPSFVFFFFFFVLFSLLFFSSFPFFSSPKFIIFIYCI